MRQLFPTPPGGKKHGKCQQIWHVTPKAWQLVCDFFFHDRRNSGVGCVFEERETDLLQGQPRGIHAWLRVSELLLVGQVGLPACALLVPAQRLRGIASGELTLAGSRTGRASWSAGLVRCSLSSRTDIGWLEARFSDLGGASEAPSLPGRAAPIPHGTPTNGRLQRSQTRGPHMQQQSTGDDRGRKIIACI